MATVNLACYTIRVKERYTDEYYDLGDISGESFVDILNEFLNSISRQPEVYENDKKAIQCREHNIHRNFLNGTITTGEYGYENELRNIHDNTLSYRKEVNDVELYPFYFLTEDAEIWSIWDKEPIYKKYY